MPQKGSILRRWEQRLRWAFRSLRHPAEMLAWFEWLDGPSGRSWAERDPDLPFKALRDFQSTRWNLPRRIRVLRDTLEVFGGNPVMRRALIAPAGAVLGYLPLRSGGFLQITLSAQTRLRKEGLLSLHLREMGGESIGALTFAFERRPGGLTCTIGGLQGGRDQAETVRRITKELYGMRPKALLVFLVRILAETLQARSLRGVGPGIHPIYRRRRPSFDYVSLWLEIGGTPAEDGWFDLPLDSYVRTQDEIKPHKRAQYAKRYLMLGDLANQVRATLAGGVPSGEARAEPGRSRVEGLGLTAP